MNHEKIKQIAKERRDAGETCVVNDLLALDRSNDPFYVGTPTQIKLGEFFADIWGKYCGDGFHLRDCHYAIIDQGIIKPDGEVYENTEEDWEYLCRAASYARHLKLVDAAKFTDSRTDDPINIIDYMVPDPGHELEYGNLASFTRPSLPHLIPIGFDGEYQPYNLEIWIEKSNKKNELIEICRKYKVLLQIGTGFNSITSAIRLLERARAANRPTRIFYISDFDPAGKSMPIGLSRNIEFYDSDNLDIKLYPIMITEDQVNKYQLPRIPTKKDKNYSKFIDAHGDGMVEINALTGRHPGEFEKIVIDEIKKYHDPSIDHEVAQAEWQFQRELEQERDNRLDDIQDRIDDFYSRFDDATKEIRENLKSFNSEFNELDREVTARLQDIEIYPDGLPCGLSHDNENPALYDSNLDYFDQLERYKKY